MDSHIKSPIDEGDSGKFGLTKEKAEKMRVNQHKVSQYKANRHFTPSSRKDDRQFPNSSKEPKKVEITRNNSSWSEGQSTRDGDKNSNSNRVDDESHRSHSNNNVERNKNDRVHKGNQGTRSSSDTLQNLNKPVSITAGATLSVNRKTFKDLEKNISDMQEEPPKPEYPYKNDSYQKSAAQAQAHHTKTVDSKTLVNPMALANDIIGPKKGNSNNIRNSNATVMNKTHNNKNQNGINKARQTSSLPLTKGPSSNNANLKQQQSAQNSGRSSNNVPAPRQAKRVAINDLTSTPDEPKKSPRLSNRTPKAPEIVDLLDDSDDDIDNYNDNGNDKEDENFEMEIGEATVESRLGQPPICTFHLESLYINKKRLTTSEKYSMTVKTLPPNSQILYIPESKRRDKISVDFGLIQCFNYGDYGPVDGILGFIQIVRWSESESEADGECEHHTIVAKREDIKTIIKLLRNRHGEIITEITDMDTINDIMAVDCEYRAEVEEKNSSRKRKRRSVAALPVGENPEDNDMFLVYPTDPDAFDPITITKGCIKRLEQGEYFNDNLIDYKIKRYMEELAMANPEQRNKVHAFSCQFWIKMTEKKNPKDMYELVARWTKEIDIFALDFLFVPVNMGSHWSLSVIVRPGLIKNINNNNEPSQDTDADDSTNKPCIMFMDSLDLHGSFDIAKKLRSYVEYEWNVKKQKLDINTLKRSPSQDKKGQIFLDTRNFPVVKCNVPVQPNGTDCGVYVIRFVKLVLELWPSSLQKDINEKMKAQIKRNSFDHDDIISMRLEIKGHIESIKGNNINH